MAKEKDYTINVQRVIGKTLPIEKVREQIQKIVGIALKGSRGTGWTHKIHPITLPAKNEGGDGVIHTVSVSFTMTSARESLTKKWPRIVERFAKAGSAGSFKQHPWTVTFPDGYKHIAEKAKMEHIVSATLKVKANEDKKLGDVNLDPNGEFTRLYGREAQIRRVMGALTVGKATNWNKRKNCLLDGPPGCHVKGTKLLLDSGREIAVEDVQVGYRLLSHDGYRNVLELIRGTGKLYKVVPVKGDPFVVNEDHVLTLVKSREPNAGEWVDVSVKEWLDWSNAKKSDYKLFRSGRVNFNVKNSLPIDPYSLGLLIGDGSLVRFPRFTSHIDDFPFYPEISLLAESFGLTVNVYPRNNQFEISLTNPDEWRANYLQQKLRELGVGEKRADGKFIPLIYKTASYKDRLELLAGLIDTDGSQSGNVICFDSKSEELVRDVMFIARSLGFAAYYGQKMVEGTVYHRAHLSGDLHLIPCRLTRKRCHPRQQIKDVLRTGFTVEPAGEGDFYGFQLDGDHRYLMSDFTVTHNSGKTELMKAFAKDARQGE
jgi:hypothetical protein